jgi:serine/threonine protein kinase
MVAPVLILALLGGIACLVLFVLLLVPIFKGIGWVVGTLVRGVAALVTHAFRFVYGMLADALRLIGAIITGALFVPLVLVNVMIGRWSAARHFGNALQDECRAAAACVYRVVIGHPARLLLLHSVTEGIEKRLPQAVASAPGPDRPRSRANQFEGYTIVGSLQGGGSGAKLYVAEPAAEKRAALERSHADRIDQVVIKSFSIHEGSSLPQIVRESRSLEAARKLGLVLDHELAAERFYYVMPYVPGDRLTTVGHRLHAACGPGGLSGQALRSAVGYVADLVRTLEHYHRGGLWHKDVKPDNIIVSHDGRAHLVDLGLVTPLRSAMTLTTHGTEYFRDPEMVRMALRGAKVHEIDGGKVDVYAAGAVLFSLIEDSFPAHGELSRITRRCPEALRWVVRRAMAPMNKRYASAGEMLADLQAILNAEDPFLLRPKDLPSVGGQGGALGMGGPVGHFAGYDDPHHHHPHHGHAHRQHERAAGHEPVRIRMVNWWSGAYEAHAARSTPRPPADLPDPADYFAARDAVPVVDAPERRVAFAPPRPGHHAHAARPTGRTAEEIRRHAQERVRRRQKAAAERRAAMQGGFNTNPGAGVITAAVLFLVFLAFVATQMFSAPRARQAAGLFDPDLKHRILGLPDGSEPGVEMNAVGNERRQMVVSRVLLLNDNRGATTPEVAKALRETAKSLRSLGLGVLGMDNTGEDLELIASARAWMASDDDTAGATPIDRLRAWLGTGAVSAQHAVDAVVWVQATSTPARCVVMAREGIHAVEFDELIGQLNDAARGRLIMMPMHND